MAKRLGNIYGFAGGNYAGNVYDTDALSPTLNTMQGGNKQPMIVENNYIYDRYSDFIDKHGYIPEMFNPYNRREITDIAPTQTVSCGHVTNSSAVIVQDKPSMRIRKLTPRECYRLMGFDDESFDKAEKVNSNSQLYKQAGNSIVVDVLVAIFDNLLLHGRSVWLDELLSDEEETA